MRDEDGMATILGHEIAHVVARTHSSIPHFQVHSFLHSFTSQQKLFPIEILLNLALHVKISKFQWNLFIVIDSINNTKILVMILFDFRTCRWTTLTFTDLTLDSTHICYFFWKLGTWSYCMNSLTFVTILAWMTFTEKWIQSKVLTKCFDCVVWNVVLSSSFFTYLWTWSWLYWVQFDNFSLSYNNEIEKQQVN
jgi:hypothetical protein